jgi:hypothetical protein
MGDLHVSTSVLPSVSDEPVGRAVINKATADTHSIVTASAGKKIRILALWLITGGTTNINFETGTTDLWAPVALNSGQILLPYNPSGWFETTAGQAFGITLSQAIQTSGHVVYQYV